MKKSNQGESNFDENGISIFKKSLEEIGLRLNYLVQVQLGQWHSTRSKTCPIFAFNSSSSSQNQSSSQTPQNNPELDEDEDYVASSSDLIDIDDSKDEVDDQPSLDWRSICINAWKPSPELSRSATRSSIVEMYNKGMGGTDSFDERIFLPISFVY